MSGMRRAKAEALKKVSLGDLLGGLNEGDVRIAIQPPVKANEVVTDEDSGEEDLNINNLPGSILAAPAEIMECEACEDEEEEVAVPVKKLQRKWIRKDIECMLPVWGESEENQEDPEIDVVSAVEMFLPNSLISLIVDMSNKYALQRNEDLHVTLEEMKTFFAILFLSEYVPLPRYEMFWEKAPDVVPIAADSMRRSRFRQIKQFLHVSDNNALNKDDKFAKMRPLIEQLNDIFLKLSPKQEFHSVDESMAPYYGRHSTKQFIRGKPIRFGYKFWCGCLPNGFIVWFEPYGGKSTSTSDKELGVGGNVVMTYAKRLLQKEQISHHLVFDNFFTSFQLLESLTKCGQKGTGTVRKNRIQNCPLEYEKVLRKKGRGSMIYKLDTTSNILLCQWHDNNIVLIASNAAGIEPQSKVGRWSQSEKRKIQIDRPYLVEVYNQNMGGVDRMDQNVSMLRMSIRSKKWWYPIFAYCLEVAKHNAWQYYRQRRGKLDFLGFTRVLVNSWLKKYGTTPTQGHRKQGKPSTLARCVRFDGYQHWPIEQPSQTRCGSCHKKTTTRCQKCDVGLHIRCFIDYH